jgi:hypothetical protein
VDHSKDGGELERTASGSKESEEGSGVGGKKKTKKKKRSVLANQSNPHHVDNCKLAFPCDKGPPLTCRPTIPNHLFDW